MTEDRPNLFSQLSELHRERSMRQTVYPKLIAMHKLNKAKAEFQMRCLDAAIESLEQLEGKEKAS